MATTGIQLRTILLAIKQRIIDTSVYPANRCHIALRMNPPSHDFRQYCTILPLMQRHDQANKAGMGRNSPIIEGRINVYCWHQHNEDQSYFDDAYLTDDSGLLDKLAQVEDALDQWTPLDGSDPLTVQPIFAQFANEPRKEYRSPDFGCGMIELDIAYRAWRQN